MKTLLLVFLCVGLVGCGGEKQRHYRVAKEEASPLIKPQAENPDLGLEKQAAGFARPQWQVPQGWQEGKLGSLRKGSYLITREDMKAEVTVLAFPGDVGGTLANINRWAGQVGVPEWTAEELQKAGRVDIDGEQGVLVELYGVKEGVMGIIIERGNETWFFKNTGDIELVKEEEENFLAFVKSVRFAKGAVQ